ncbi:lysophospholipid acyltransferase family protein [Falsiroseomonas sp. HW251]|uniref:lysophospholipid acyltransferase family protein n=1 Tax=Falsiroseomonas sp. HW251 TaxID=3390998 RepID=UPI003D30FF78
MTEWKFSPARDLALAPSDRWRSLARERGLFELAANGLWRRVLRLYLAVAHRLEVTGRENLPAPPFCMIGNHTSHLDALTFAAALRGDAARAAHALAAEEVFFGSDATAAFAAYAINALPVRRGRTTRGEIETLRSRLVEDRLVYILFPEGTRSRSGEPGEFKPGLATLVLGSDVPVVPCWLDGAHAAWPPDRKWPRPGKLSLSIGKPLRFGDLPANAAGRAALTAAAREAVLALRP